MSYTALNQEPTVALACELVSRPSVTPTDAGCQGVIAERLAALGFAIQVIEAGEVVNLWAKWGNTAPLWVFAGHTDVVPPGPLDRWSSLPFVPTLRDGELVGRGIADMKGALAAMVVAVENFFKHHPNPPFSLGFLLTSDEEGPAIHGTDYALRVLHQQGERISGALIGEPSSVAKLGDQIKHGRRGSLHGHLIIEGKQGHVAYPHLVQNPIPVLSKIIAQWSETVWDRGNEDFPPTSLQVSNFLAGNGALNVVPGTAECRFNFRFSPASTVDMLKTKIHQIVETVLLNEEVEQGHVLGYRLEWSLSGVPFVTHDGPFRQAVMQAIYRETGEFPRLSTDGGTSDGRFIAPYGIPVVEMGLLNGTIHQIDERVTVTDLPLLTRIYEQLLVQLQRCA